MTNLTKNRRKPFSCGHRGLGASCNRCFQANELEVRANELAQAFKNKAKTLPKFVETTADTLTVRAGGVRVTSGIVNNNIEPAITSLVSTMREHATRLQKASNLP